MKGNEMSDEIRKTYTMLLNKAKPEINRHRRTVIIASLVVFLAVLGGMIWFWIMPTVTYRTVLLVGGQLYSLYGAVILAVAALSSKDTLGLMCMTFPDGNTKLFAGFMKSRFSALVGICFIIGGFFIQGLAMVVFGS